jgi:hypothetical protein
MDLESYPESVQTITRHARKLLREWLPGAKESVDESARMFAYAYAPGYKGMVCTLILSKTGIKLGIVRGATFPDPHNLLRGVGKVHRHVPMKALDDLRQPGVRELVAAASAACKAQLTV